MVGRCTISTSCRLDCGLHDGDHHHQLVWCPWIRRRRVLGLSHEVDHDHLLLVHGCHLRLWRWSCWRRVSDYSATRIPFNADNWDRYTEYKGGANWQNPGAFTSFVGFCGVFVTAAFSFSGTELVGLAAAESENPAKALPSAIKQVFWRITLFYILSLTFVGLLIPYNDPNLLGSGSMIDVETSPFVIVAERAGIIGFAHFTNVVIMLSVVSIGLSGVYGGSRTLTALAEQGYAPRFFTYVDRAGRPLWSTIFVIAWSPLAFMTLSTGGSIAFDWLQSLSGLAALFTWGSICFAHIRFRRAWAYHGHTVDEIPFTAIFGVTGSWIGLGLVIVVLIAQFYVAVNGAIADNSAEPFFKSYLAFFVVCLFYACGWLWKRSVWKTLAEIDVDSGRREVDWETVNKQRARYASWPWWRKFLSKFF